MKDQETAHRIAAKFKQIRYADRFLHNWNQSREHSAMWTLDKQLHIVGWTSCLDFDFYTFWLLQVTDKDYNHRTHLMVRFGPQGEIGSKWSYDDDDLAMHELINWSAS